MARDPLQPHYYSENGRRYILQLPDVYDANGSTVGQAFGISKAQDSPAAPFEPADNDIGLTVSEGLKNGRLVRVRISYRTAGGQAKSARLVCPTGRADTGIAAARAKNYKSRPITGSGIPRRRRLG